MKNLTLALLMTLAVSRVPAHSEEVLHGDLDSSVTIIDDGEQGSGVYIGEGRIVTAGHMVDDNDEAGHFPSWKHIQVLTAYGETIHATVVWYSKKYDIAMLKLDRIPNKIGFAAPALTDAPVGTAIRVEGNPLGEHFVNTWGHIGGSSRTFSDWLVVTPIDVQICRGNSGGPVYIDGTNTVVGIIVGQQLDPMGTMVLPGHINYMVPTSVVRWLIGHPPKFVTPTPAQQEVAIGGPK